jgi:hypothetical protein
MFFCILVSCSPTKLMSLHCCTQEYLKFPKKNSTAGMLYLFVEDVFACVYSKHSCCPAQLMERAHSQQSRDLGGNQKDALHKTCFAERKKKDSSALDVLGAQAGQSPRDQ